MTKKLTKEQLENWRKSLSGVLGLGAYLLSDKQIEEYRDTIETRLRKDYGDKPRLRLVDDGEENDEN